MDLISCAALYILITHLNTIALCFQAFWICLSKVAFESANNLVKQVEKRALIYSNPYLLIFKAVSNLIATLSQLMILNNASTKSGLLFLYFK